ncbi:hypothetical protein PVAND_016620 [Polypedilum vanderplanki]|uniref:Uncharacterized protein n=1 Tax=Polypedilum vanderplanki TaxID=319348 RepID=A0A9J6BGQ2_POLVA|nr:hypothetical protein PVAND_016620 [Polypedilum vanderplanki]
MKILIIFVLISSIAIAKRTYNNPFEFYVTFKSVKVDVTQFCRDNYLHNVSFWIKNYNRTYSTINFSTFAKRNLTSPHMEGTLFYKYGTIYREVFHFPRFNVCDVLSKYKVDKLHEVVFNIVLKVAPTIIHECPYWYLESYNISLRPKQTFFMLPQGDYKGTGMLLEDIYGPLLGNGTIILTVNSPFKESFGKK